MKDDEFCQMFLSALINLICFLLSVICLTCLYNVNSQIKILGIEKISDYVSYRNSYTATAVLFTFEFFGFVGFMIILMLLIKHSKVNNADKERRILLDILEVKKMLERNEETKDIIPNYIPIKGERFTLDSVAYIKAGTMIKIMLFLFVYCQCVILIQVIVLTAYLYKSIDLQKKLENQFGEKKFGKYLTSIYRDLIIAGYTFLVLFIFFDLYTLILVTKCGRREEKKKIDNKNYMEDFSKHRYCGFFSNCLTKCCEKMGNAFKACEREDEENKGQLEEDLKKFKEELEELKAYSNNLGILNEKIKNKQNLKKDDFDKLYLPKLDTPTTSSTMVSKFNKPNNK